MSTLRSTLSNKPWILALIMTLLLVLWMSSGNAESSEPEDASENKEQVLQKVEVTRFNADDVAKTLTLYGRSEPDRQAMLKAEVSGKITEVFEKRGSVVKKGEPLVRIAMNDLEAQLASAKATVKQRQMEYKGIKSLSDKGLQDESRLAQTEANLARAKADVARLELAVKNTLIVAPFDGMLNERFVEVGDYVQVGDNTAQVVDLNPLVIRAAVTEMDVTSLTKQQAATAKFVNGKTVSGNIRYIATVADDKTNTFEIEVAIENPDREWLAGASAELEVPLQTSLAIKVSPAVLALDEDGSVGVKTVQQDIVYFQPIDIVKTDDDGMWLAGLGQSADIITLGQGFVRAGDKVDAKFADAVEANTAE